MAADEIRSAGINGVSITTAWSSANVAANATAAAIIWGGGVTTPNGFTVPTGYVFKPLYVYAEANADLTAGTVTIKVTANNTAILNGPEPALSDTVQANHAVCRPQATAGVAAGADVGIHVISSSAAPTTCEVDIILVGAFFPA